MSIPAGNGEVTACHFEVTANGRSSEKADQNHFALTNAPYPAPRRLPTRPDRRQRRPPRTSEVGTTYHYRLVASNASDTGYGQVRTFRVPGVPISPFRPNRRRPRRAAIPTSRPASTSPTAKSWNFPTECFCQDAQTITNHLPAGVIGNPHAVPYCTLAQIGTTPAHPIARSAPSGPIFLSGNFFSPLYNVEPDPDQAGCSASNSPSPTRRRSSKSAPGPAATTASTRRFANVPQIVPPEGSVITLWGVPADPSHDAYRVSFGAIAHFSEAEPPEEVQGGELPCGRARLPPPAPASPSSTTRPPASDRSPPRLKSSPTTPAPASPPTPPTRRPTGCDSLTFNPSLSAQPTTAATDTPSGLEVDLSVPQEREPRSPLSLRDPRRHGQAARGLLDQPRRRRRQERLHRRRSPPRHPRRSPVPRNLQGRHRLAQQLRPARHRSPASSTSCNPSPATATASSSPPTASPPTSSWSAPSPPKPAQVSSPPPSPTCPRAPSPTSTSTSSAPNAASSPPPPSAAHTPCRAPSPPGTPPCPNRRSTQFFNVTSGPGGSSCPGSTRPFNPGLQASSVDSTAGAHSPFSLELTRSDGDQNLSSLERHHPARLLGDPEGNPLLPPGIDRSRRRPKATPAPIELANPSCPAASQVGESISGAGAGNHPVYLPGKVYLAGPYKGAPLSLVIITPAVSGPYDLGNVVVRDSASRQPRNRPDHRRLRPPAPDLRRHPPAPALGPGQPQPPELRPQPDQLRSLLRQHRSLRHRRRPRQALRPLPGRQLPHPRLCPQALDALHRLHQARRHPLPARDPRLPAGQRLRQHRPRHRHPAAHRDRRQRPHQQPLHPGPVFAEGSTPRRKVPAGLGPRLRQGRNPAARKAPRRPGLPALRRPATSSPTSSPPSTARSTSPSTATSTPSTAASAPASKPSPTPPSPTSPSPSTAATRASSQNNTNLCSHALHVTADITGQNGKTANQNPVLETPCGKKHKRVRHERSKKHRAKHHRKGSVRS